MSLVVRLQFPYAHSVCARSVTAECVCVCHRHIIRPHDSRNCIRGTCTPHKTMSPRVQSCAGTSCEPASMTTAITPRARRGHTHTRIRRRSRDRFSTDRFILYSRHTRAAAASEMRTQMYAQPRAYYTIFIIRFERARTAYAN